MDAQITLTTSDDPPVSLSISRSALVAHSKVFCDMLSLDLKSDDGDTSIPLAETEMELKSFLLLVQGQESEVEKRLSGSNEKDWETFAKLSDKYDSATGRVRVQIKIWEIEAKSDSAAFAFTLATLIGNEGLITYTAKRAVLLPDLQVASFHAAQEWKERLAAWRTMKAANDLLALRRISKDPPLHNGLEHCRRGNCPGTAFWKQACGNAVGDYDICRSLPFSLVCLLEHPQLCSTYTSKIQDHAEKFEQETSKWPDFPVKGLTFGSMGHGLMWKI